MTNITRTDAREAIETDKKDRIQRVATTIQKILEQEKCKIVPVFVIRGNQIEPRIDIEALDG